MFIPSNKKDVVLTVIFCAMMAVIIFLWRSNSRMAANLVFAELDLKMAKMNIESAQCEIKSEKAAHEYTKVLLDGQKSKNDTLRMKFEDMAKK